MILRPRHIVAALVLHAVLISLLVFGVQCSSKPVRPPVIQAVLLDKSRQQVAEQQRQERERKAEERRRLEAAAKQREAEALRQKQAEADRQKRLAEQKRKDDEARRQKELAAQKKAEQEKKKAEEAARRKQEQDEQREKQEQAARDLQEKARMEEQMRQEAVARDVAREQAAREASEREKRQAEWVDVLARHIQKYWIRPASAGSDFQCTVNVKLLPDGSVTYAKIDKSCGSPQLDRSVEDAVYRASPLPKPADPSVFDRDLVINFEPGP